MLDFNGERPIFLQLADELQEGIISGIYPEQSQIPSITEYSVAYKINPATALKGINLLVDEGLLYKKRGIGMFVSDGAKEKLLAIRRNDFFVKMVAPLIKEAEYLNMNKTELLDMIERGYENGNKA